MQLKSAIVSLSQNIISKMFLLFWGNKISFQVFTNFEAKILYFSNQFLWKRHQPEKCKINKSKSRYMWNLCITTFNHFAGFKADKGSKMITCLCFRSVFLHILNCVSSKIPARNKQQKTLGWLAARGKILIRVQKLLFRSICVERWKKDGQQKY